MKTVTEKNTATFIHLSMLTQYFIPFGNYIFPILIWSTKKDSSEFVDYNGKQALNFQLSLLMYCLILISIAVPCFLFTIFNNIPFETIITQDHFSSNHFDFGSNIGLITAGFIALFLAATIKVAEFFLIVYAAIKTSNGELFKYPATINFIK
ncbi:MULTISPECIES: DUF4870 domain-containing protein [unclassified Flavobacterium]|uniref:DUF4870 domain-containing protein n=1 Tax=unclassified Flavobacterium TaxID=196869 RepID=UPI00156E8615|nr:MULTISPECIES: DUF4870 domain-containing protein [unclassified Flavobacterium]MBE0391009.1 hypothetical protein [Flavobacterium sp. PL002]NRT15258.1 hypothetical protein [Flavobacterium sp. 28A]